MKIIRAYLELKRQDEQTVYFIKCGMFYISLNDDVLFLKNKGYDFKVTNINNKDIKIGFPLTSKEKYERMFKNDFKYKFVEDFEEKDYTKLV